jgi:hypothetical protein
MVVYVDQDRRVCKGGVISSGDAQKPKPYSNIQIYGGTNGVEKPHSQVKGQDTEDISDRL